MINSVACIQRTETFQTEPVAKRITDIKALLMRTESLFAIL